MIVSHLVCLKIIHKLRYIEHENFLPSHLVFSLFLFCNILYTLNRNIYLMVNNVDTYSTIQHKTQN